MRILLAGNSITRGQIGESFVELLHFDNPTWSISNAGVNGDTLINISDRLVNILSSDSKYDFVVIEAGHNDIIIPYLNKKGVLFQYAYKHLLRIGRQPLSIKDFSEEYLKLIKQLRTKTTAKLVLTSLSCINEHLLSETNLKRIEYNDAIREIAKQTDCILADISVEFDSILKKASPTDYLLEDFWHLVYLDKKLCQQKGGAEKLSKKRNLRLTIDGVHLNKEGATLYRQTIEKIIKNGMKKQT